MSERYKIINHALWDLEKPEILLIGKNLGLFQTPCIHGYSVCDILNELNQLNKDNESLKHLNDCLQKQLNCTNKNYNELSKRYYNLQNSNKLRTDEPLLDASLEKRLIDCEEYLKKMQSERDIYKNKYEKLSKKSKELFLHLKNTVVWYLGKAFANTNINEIYYNKILNCLDDIETKLIGDVNNEKV